MCALGKYAKDSMHRELKNKIYYKIILFEIMQAATILSVEKSICVLFLK